MEGKKTAVVDSFGVPRQVGIMLVPDVKIDDFVLVHAGHALEKIDPAEAEERIKLWEEMLEKEEE